MSLENEKLTIGERVLFAYTYIKDRIRNFNKKEAVVEEFDADDEDIVT